MRKEERIRRTKEKKNEGLNKKQKSYEESKREK
jgi:hypothetical protein